MDYKAEIAKLLEPVEDGWLLNLIYRTIVNLLKPDDVQEDISMEQMKKEVLEMVEKICSNEKAISYVHGFLKAFIERYM